MSVTEIRPDVYWIGVNDRKTDLFEGIWPILEGGIVNNAYFINDEKRAIIDSAKAFQQNEFIEKVSQITDPSKIDYIVINHMEPDHSGLLEAIRNIAPNATLIGTNRTKDLLKAFYGITDRVSVVSNNETLSLGKRTLKFISTPMVHWPETMMTYEVVDRVLFSGDGFGGYGSLGEDIFDDTSNDIEHYLKESLRYYTNIVVKFSPMVKKAVDRLSEFDIAVVAPSHGLIWRKEPERIIRLYKEWSECGEGKTQDGITVVHATMYGNTEQMLKKVLQVLEETGIPFETFDICRTHSSYILPSLWTRRGVIIAAPTYEVSLFPPMAYFLDMALRKGMKDKKVIRFGSYGWSGGAQKEFENFAGQMEWEIFDSFEFNGRPTEEDFEKGASMTKKFIGSF